MAFDDEEVGFNPNLPVDVPAPTPIGPQQAQLGPQPFVPAVADAIGSVLGSTGQQPAPPVTPAPGTPIAQSSKTGVEVSRSGLTPEGQARVNALWGDQRGSNATMRQADKMLGGYKQTLTTAATDYTKSNDAAKAAANEASLAESEYHQGLKGIHERERDFLETQRHVEEQFYHRAKVEREQYLAGYQQEMAAVRNLMAQNANPMAGLSGTQGLGMGIAMFAQGFLGARGIHIDVAGQLDKWVDRELQQHQQKIVNQRGMAESQLTLYNLARQSSQDDAEARQKLRGFAIEGFKLEVQAQADRFGSDIAKAKAKATIAGLDKELATTFERLGSAYQQARMNAYNSIVDEHAKMGQLAIQREKMQLDEARANRLEQAAKAKAQQDAQANVVYDTTRLVVDKLGNYVSGGSKARWEFLPGTQPEEMKKFREVQTAYTTVSDKLEQLTKMQADYGKLSPLARTRWASEYEAKLLALADDIIMTRQKAVTGAAATNEERKMIASAIRTDLLGGTATAASVLNQSRAVMADEFQKHVNTYTRPLAADDPRRNLSSSTNADRFGAGVYAEAKAGSADAKPETASDYGTQLLTGPDRFKAADEDMAKTTGVSTEEAASIWGTFKVKAPKLTSDGKLDEPDYDISLRNGADAGLLYSSLKNSFNQLRGANEGKAPQFAQGIIAIAKDAANGDKLSRAKLQDVAYGGIEGGLDDFDRDRAIIVRDFARHAAERYGVKLDTTQKPKQLATHVIPPHQEAVDDPNSWAPKMTWVEAKPATQDEYNAWVEAGRPQSPQGPGYRWYIDQLATLRQLKE